MILTKIGLICDLTYKHHIGFMNCYHALTNLFGNVKIINGVNDLKNVDLIFMANDHWAGHRRIWENDNFIKQCNELNIRLVVFTEETILSPYHTWNVAIQENLERFNNLHQYVIDVDDALSLNKKLMRGLISINYKNCIKHKDKKDACVFIGKYQGIGYEERRQNKRR